MPDPAPGAVPADAAADTLRIGIDVREWHRGTSTGIGRVVTNFLRWAIERTPHRFVLFGNQHTEFRLSAPALQAVTLREGTRLVWDHVRLPRALRAHDVGVLLSPYYKGPLRSPCPVVVTANDLIDLHVAGGSHPLKRLLLPWWMGLMLRRADHVLTLSEHARDDIVRRLGVSAAHVTAFPLAVDERFLRPIPPGEAERVRVRHGLPERYVLYVGRCAPHKNVDTLLRGWRRLPARLQRTYGLVLAGSDRHRFRAAVAAADVPATLTGYVADVDLPGLYAGATLLCFPSRYEGFGLPPLEAMACGTPVVAADATSIPEVVGDAARLVDPDDAAAWGAAIEQLLEDRPARARLIAAGGERARSFSLERSGSSMMRCLAAVAREAA